MLLLPLLYMSTLLTGAAASGLNSFALQKRSLGLLSATDAPDSASDAGSAAAGSGRTISLGYLAQHLHRLLGNRVVLDGRVFRDTTLPPGRFVIYRFVVVCCAADAMPIQVVVQSPRGSNFHDDDWVRVAGTFRSEERDGKVFYFIDADQVDAIATPQEPYLSPYRF
jgi:uncharacterized repeat protein (TIGR03943 family)